MDEEAQDQLLDDQAEELQQLRAENEQLERENHLLEAFVEKAQQQGLVPQAEPEQGKKPKAASRRNRDALPPPPPEAFARLSDDEKGDIVSQAIEALHAEMEQVRSAGERDIDDVRAMTEEVDLRIAEARKDTYEFKRDVVVGAEDPRTGRTSAEKVTRFLEDKVRAKQVQVEKLTLKNTTCKAAIAKLEAQLAHKEEAGEVLHLVDFEQLRIENQQHLERIDAKNRELLELKLSTGRTVQVLNRAKERMAALQARGAQLRSAAAARQRELGEFDQEFDRATGRAASAAAGFRRLQGQLKEADQPQIMDYLKLKKEVAELQNEAAGWARKLEVAAGGGSGKAGGGGGLVAAGGARRRPGAASAAPGRLG